MISRIIPVGVCLILGLKVCAQDRLRFGVTNDLFDVSQGTVVLAHSGAAFPTSAGNALGDDIGHTDVEPGSFIGTDGQPPGYVHFLEWKTKIPVTVRSLRIHAAGDGAVYLFGREFTRFLLKTKSPGSPTFDREIFENIPTHPYTFVNPTHNLVIASNVNETTGQEFRAEFTDIGSRYWSGPRIIEIDAFDVPIAEVPPLPDRVDVFPPPTGVLVASPAGGFFTNRVQVSLTGAIGGEQIRYSVNGTEPGISSPLYSGPFNLTVSATVKAGLFRNQTAVGIPLEVIFSRVYAINDGISADWRHRFFGDGYLTDPRVAGAADPDEDGADNFQEFANGTDPTDPLSGFLATVRAVPSITWHSVPGKSYRVLRRSRIGGVQWEPIKTVVAAGLVSSYTDESVEINEAYYAVEYIRN